jgi:hypothetical protein
MRLKIPDGKLMRRDQSTVLGW